MCNLLNLSDLKKVAKILFKNTKYYKKTEHLHATLDSLDQLEWIPKRGKFVELLEQLRQREANAKLQANQNAALCTYFELEAASEAKRVRS